MKLCVVSTGVFAHVPPQGTVGYSGLESLMWNLAKGLSAKGHEVALVAPEGSSCPNVTIIPIGPPGSWDEKKSYAGYWQHLNNFDAIIDSSWQKWSYQLKIEGRLKAPILGVCHAPVNTMMQELPPVEKPCFVCISDDQRSHFEGLFGRPARTAYNGIDLDFYKPISVPRANRFLFLARFSTIKGPDLAIQACKELGVGLDLVGDISITQEPQYLEQCKQMCDGKLIKLLGPCNRGEAVYHFSKAHCLLHPNQRFREPFGLAPVESMACGCPVIAWDNGAMRETNLWRKTDLIVKGDKQGQPITEHALVHSVDELKNAIKWAVENITPTDRENCIEQAHRFSIQRMCNRYEELCYEALSGGW